MAEINIYWVHKKAEQYWFEKNLKKCKIPKGVFKEYVGFAVVPSQADPIPMVLSEDMLKMGHMLFAASFVCGIAGKDHTILAISPAFYMDLLKDEKLESLIDHELGHIVHGHFAKSIKQENAERDAAQAAGKVHSHELEADQFAMNRRGRDNLIYTLEYMLNHINMHFAEHNVSEKFRQLAMEEIANRIEHLKNHMEAEG